MEQERAQSQAGASAGHPDDPHYFDRAQRAAIAAERERLYRSREAQAQALPRPIWPYITMAIFASTVVLSVGAWALRSWAGAPAPAPASAQRTVNPDGTSPMTIDNSKLLLAVAFGQKPNGHVDPIKFDAEGRVICAPQPAQAPATAPAK